MLRRLLPLLTCLAIIGGGVSSSARSASTATIDVVIAKTQAAIDPFGIVEPARPRRNVIVKLSVDKGNGFEARRTKTVALQGNADSDGDGVPESSFDTHFARPAGGTCRIVALFKRSGRAPLRDEEVFACAIPEFGRGEATIIGDGHGPVEVDLLIAENDEQRGYGLSFRRRLASDRGMVFLFQGDTNAAFWMQNTLIPLSIAFFDTTDTIIDIQDMDPCREGEACPTHGPNQTYRGALEVNQGAFEEWGVEVGDTIVITR